MPTDLAHPGFSPSDLVPPASPLAEANAWLVYPGARPAPLVRLREPAGPANSALRIGKRIGCGSMYSKESSLTLRRVCESSSVRQRLGAHKLRRSQGRREGNISSTRCREIPLHHAPGARPSATLLLHGRGTGWELVACCACGRGRPV